LPPASGSVASAAPELPTARICISSWWRTADAWTPPPPSVFSPARRVSRRSPPAAAATARCRGRR
jgi:hypothetical protein